MELYRKVRLACRDGMSERAAARHFGVSRQSVRKMLQFSVPPGYRRTAPVRRPKLDEFTALIEQWLEDDRRHGYLPIDKTGADLLFQIISQRYERGSIAITTNRVFKHWPEIFNHDATLTSAVLDRLLHHAETVTVEGNSFRMKDVIDK